jgi:hypothetical protein
MDVKSELEALPPRIADFKRQLALEIPCVPDNASVRGELVAMPLARLIATYLNWKDRSLAPHPRQTVIWNGLHRHTRGPIDWGRIFNLVELSSKGVSLNRHLSRLAATHGYVPRSAERKGIEWGDKDLALNAYGVHHLHLVPANVTGKRKGDSNRLLFVVASRDTMALLMVGDHSSFDDGTLFSAVTEFRADTDFWIRDALPAREPLGAKESAKMLRFGVMAMGVHGGKLVPTAFLSSMGTSLWHTRHADRIVLTLEEWEAILNDRTRCVDAFKQKGWIPQNPVWRWELIDADLYLREVNTGAAGLVVPWER